MVSGSRHEFAGFLGTAARILYRRRDFLKRRSGLFDGCGLLFRAARESADRSPGSIPASALCRTVRGTSMLSTDTPSNATAISRNARSPSALTRRTISAMRSFTGAALELFRPKSDARWSIDRLLKAPMYLKRVSAIVAVTAAGAPRA